MELTNGTSSAQSDDRELCQRVAKLIKREQKNLLTNWRSRVRELPSAADLDVPTLNDDIPLLLRQFTNALEGEDYNEDDFGDVNEVDSAALLHGLHRANKEYKIEEVVAEYGLLTLCIHDLAEEHHLTLQGPPFRILNYIVSRAVSSAVRVFAAEQALKIQERREEHLSFVVHDLRTPVSAISVCSNLLEQELKKEKKEKISPMQTRLVATLNKNVTHLNSIVNQVLEESSVIQGKIDKKLVKRTFDLWPFIESLVQALHSLALDSETDLKNDVPMSQKVYADADRLRRVFQNLIMNAISHTPRGKVIIGARDIPETDEMEAWVEDNGSGISEDMKDKIFEKYQGDTEGEQTSGLGLSIVKKFVEAHDGTVKVESKKGKGAIFRIRIPAAS